MENTLTEMRKAAKKFTKKKCVERKIYYQTGSILSADFPSF